MNIKEQIAAKVETVNTVIKYIEELQKTPNDLSVDNVLLYLKSMKENYKATYEFISSSSTPAK